MPRSSSNRSLQRRQPVTNPKRQSSGAAFAPITKYYATTRHQSFLASLGSRFAPNQSRELSMLLVGLAIVRGSRRARGYEGISASAAESTRQLQHDFPALVWSTS